MRNKALPKLLRALAQGSDAIANNHNIIFEQAAIELEKLDTIEIVLKSIAASRDGILDLINDKV